MNDHVGGVRLADLERRLRALSQSLADLADQAGSDQVGMGLTSYLKSVIQARRLREQSLGADLFFDPGWDILLTLCLAKLEGRKVAMVDLGTIPVPATTLLRWTTRMEHDGIIIRSEDERDRRRVYVALSDDMTRRMTSYLECVSGPAI